MDSMWWQLPYGCKVTFYPQTFPSSPDLVLGSSDVDASGSDVEISSLANEFFRQHGIFPKVKLYCDSYRIRSNTPRGSKQIKAISN